MSRRIVVFYEDSSDDAVPVVLTCKQTLRETIAEALSEFQLHEQDPRLYALCLNFQELTVRLSESAFHNLPTVGRPPQLRLISLKDLKELSKAQLKHRAWDDSQADVFAQSSQQSDDHSHTTPTASTSQHGSQPKKRGRRSSQFSSSTSAANPAALWIAGGPGQGGDDDTGQRYRKRRMILGQPGQSTQRHRDEDDSDIPLQSDPHPTVADHSAQLGDENPEDAPSSPRKRARPRRSAASSAAEAIARHNSSNGHTVPTPAHTSLPAASAVTKIGVKRGRRPRKSRSHEAEADHQRVEDENQENQPHLPSDRLSSALGQSQSESNASLPIPYPMLLDNETHSDETAPLQCGVDLPDAAVSWLQKLPEPDRSREWLQICFEQFTDASILQKEVWQAYQKHTSQYELESAEALPPQVLIGLIPNIFPNSGAQTLQTEFGKSYVISNLKARRVPSWYAQQLGHVSFAEKEVVQPQIENAPAEGSQELELRAAFTGQNHAVERPDEEIIRESSSEAEPRALQEEANRSQEQRPMSPNGLHSEEPLAALSPPNESVEDSHQHQLDTESQEIASQLTAPQVDSAAPEETRAATPPREPDGGVQNASIQQLSPELPEAQEGDSALHTSKSVPSARSSRSSSPTSSEGGGRSHSGHSSEFDAYGENADIENSGNAGTDGRYVSIENHDFASSPQLGHASTLQSDSTDKHEERHHIEHVGQSSEGHIMQTEEDGLEDHHSLFYT